MPRELIEHHLNVTPGVEARKQKLRKMFANCQDTAKEEVKKLQEAGVIHEVMHSEWLANPVLVKKHNGK